MSRIGKNPIEIPNGVEVKITDNLIEVKGPKGILDLNISTQVKVFLKQKQVIVEPRDETVKESRSLWGTFQRLINNMVIGVTDGFVKDLEFNGVGWRMELKNNILVMNLGYSHPIEYKIPDGINIELEKNVIKIIGNDKQRVGQVAAEIRAFRKPEPYKGKGIKYKDEVIKRKAGKQAKTATT